MEPICTNPNCTNTINKNSDIDGVPMLETEISDGAIENLLAENVEVFHVHQYGSMVIFLEFLEGLEPSDELVDDYSRQGHVFLLPMKAYDLVGLRDHKIKHITYKASDTERIWYKIKIETKSKSVGTKLKKLFH